MLLEYGWVIMFSVPSVQRVKSVSHKTEFPFLSILLSEPSEASTRISVKAITLATRSEHEYKCSGMNTPNNVRELKRFCQANKRNQYELIRLPL